MNGMPEWFKTTQGSGHLVLYFAIYLLVIRSLTGYLFSVSLDFMTCKMGIVIATLVAVLN